jgi:hypothetical protein
MMVGLTGGLIAPNDCPLNPVAAMLNNFFQLIAALFDQLFDCAGEEVSYRDHDHRKTPETYLHAQPPFSFLCLL